jgi:predicted nucleic acid-binding protein
MTLLISDANILIDMEEGGLIEVMFNLPEKFAVPNVLFIEELVEHHPELPAHGLLVMELGEPAVAETYRLRQQYNRPSLNDLFALALAKQVACPLLTGDKHLRDAAKKENVENRGTLWLVERMVTEAVITVEQAADAYVRMRVANRRLPWPDVAKQLKRLGYKPR